MMKKEFETPQLISSILMVMLKWDQMMNGSILMLTREDGFNYEKEFI